MDRRAFLGKLLAIPAAVVALPFIPSSIRGNHVKVESTVGEPVWITAANQEIPISKLEDGHLLNIERMLRGESNKFPMLERSWDRAKQWLPLIRAEMERRKLTAKRRSTYTEYAYESWDFDVDPWGD